MEVKDSNGNLINDGDTVMVIKDLKIKGMSKVLKRGTQVKSVRLAGSNEVECRFGKSTVVLKSRGMTLIKTSFPGFISIVFLC